MLLAASHLRVRRRGLRASLAVVAALARRCNVAGDIKPDVEVGSRETVATTWRAAHAPEDGPEHDLGIRWEESLEAALERGRRETKPVLIAFSARRQDHDFACEF
jgi:hypothetical protein